MAFTPFVETDLPSMAAFNEKLQAVLGDAISNDLVLETGAYVGTGTYGEDNPNILNFSGIPKMVAVYTESGLRPGINGGGFGYSFLWMEPVESAVVVTGSNSSTNCFFAQNGNSLSWHTDNTAASTAPNYQLNANDKKYYYIALVTSEVTK